MVDDTTSANILAAILHHAANAPSADTTAGNLGTAPPATSGLASSVQGDISQTNQEGQSAIDAAAQPAASTTPAPTAATGSGDVNIPQGSDAVGLNNPAVAQGFGVNGHPGIDLSIPVGTPLLAAEDGTITAAGNTDPNGYGNEVEITAADGTVMRYGHLSGINVTLGATVKRGALIGKSGGQAGAPGSGNATGPHLHFEVRRDGSSVDPVPYLAGNTGGIVKGSATSNPAAQSAAPTDVAGTISNILDLAAGKPGHDTQKAQPATQGVQATGATGDSDPGAIDSFLAATRQHESGGDYHIYNQSGQSNASGAYQFLGSTWKSEGGSTANAADASPAEQDAIARKMANALFQQFHSWRLVAIAWYGGPGVAEQVASGQNPGSPQGQGPYLAYGDTIVNMMQGAKSG